MAWKEQTIKDPLWHLPRQKSLARTMRNWMPYVRQGFIYGMLSWDKLKDGQAIRDDENFEPIWRASYNAKRYWDNIQRYRGYWAGRHYASLYGPDISPVELYINIPEVEQNDEVINFEEAA